jgi:hypothetical protein
VEQPVHATPKRMTNNKDIMDLLLRINCPMVYPLYNGIRDDKKLLPPCGDKSKEKLRRPTLYVPVALLYCF